VNLSQLQNILNIVPFVNGVGGSSSVDIERTSQYTGISNQVVRLLIMTERQSQFLRAIIENYVVHAEPVASGILAQDSEVSSATIRNDMAVLEEEGYIVQPHTSAGRIPTAKGYQFYLEHFLKPKKPTTAHQKRLDAAQAEERAVKQVAKALSDIADLAVLVAFSKHDYYYTGISYLFSQPEFRQTESVVNISSVLDALDQTLTQLYEHAKDETIVLVGDQNPFSAQCSLLLSKATLNGKDGVMAILGPTRMNYNQNIGLLNYSKTLLT
jgi:transcriptional regulator of heat shock response